MIINITGKGIKVGDALRGKIEKKLAKYNRYFDDDVQCTVKVRPEGEQKCVEVTIKNKKSYLRSETVDDDLMDALDSCVSAMDRQIRKQKTRIEKQRHNFAQLNEYLRQEMEEVEEEILPEGSLIRHKSFDIEAMTPEEACLQMELLGHSFLLFLSDETEQVCLVYKRNDGNYGMIEPNY